MLSNSKASRVLLKSHYIFINYLVYHNTSGQTDQPSHMLARLLAVCSSMMCSWSAGHRTFLQHTDIVHSAQPESLALALLKELKLYGSGRVSATDHYLLQYTLAIRNAQESSQDSFDFQLLFSHIWIFINPLGNAIPGSPALPHLFWTSFNT